MILVTRLRELSKQGKSGFLESIKGVRGKIPANQLCFRDEPFKDPEFENLAFEIYEKFIEIKEQKKGLNQ